LAEALWTLDTDLFLPPKPNPVFAPDDHSPEYDSKYRNRRRKRFKKTPLPFLVETVADPEDISSEEQRKKKAYEKYFGKGQKPRGDPRMALPESRDLAALADSFGSSNTALAQASNMDELGMRGKAKRFLLCGRMGNRVNCSTNDAHKFFQPFFCRCRYCQTCGPAWFRKRFSDLSFALDPVIAELLEMWRARGRTAVVAKLDFTVRNNRMMPTSAKVRAFHLQMRDFWRFAERFWKIGRKEYGHAGCDEFGGSNTNLHRHSLYVGPALPARGKELSALWSIAGLKGKRRREMLRFARREGLRCAWLALAPEERCFASIKRAESFHEALAHALKYPAKFLDASSAERLAQLEFAFHRTRRFSAGAAFYNIDSEREPGQDSPVGDCPKCGGRLYQILEPWVGRIELELEGRCELEAARRETGRAKVFSG